MVIKHKICFTQMLLA